MSKIRPTLQLMATTMRTRTRTVALAAAMVVVFLITTPTQALVLTSLRGNNTRGNETSPFPTLVRVNTAMKDSNATVRQAVPGNDDYSDEEEEELYVVNHTIVCPPSSSLASVGWIRRPLEVHPRFSHHSTDQQHPRLGLNTTNTTKKVFGVNYGNIFIPEDWMLETDRTDFFQNDTTSFSVDANNDPNRLCLAGLPPDQFEVRYLTRLETMIQEEDFRRMAASGITVVRVPCGYWNWIAYPDGATPNGNHAERMRVLQSVPPTRYRPYFDRIFAYAAQHGIQVLVDLHGLPGSQNGEMHSGLTQQYSFFDTEWNKQKAIEAVEAIAQYVSSNNGSRLKDVYGIQIINEPNHFRVDNHAFLDTYYEEAIRAARRHVDARIPIIVFEWPYNFERWPDHRFPADEFGAVLWDTHVYHHGYPKVSGDPSLQMYAQEYEYDLCQITNFHQRQAVPGEGGGVIIGEWSLAGEEL